MARMLSDKYARFVNLGLRLTSLAAKLLLTLYMARFLTLGDFGEYGLTAGSVAILITVLGMRLDYVVARELVGANAFESLKTMRDQLVFYGLNYAALGIVTAILLLTRLAGIPDRTLLVICVLSVLESCSASMFANMTSLDRPIVANLMFLVRSGLWVFPAVALGLAEPEFRTSGTIFVAWISGVAASIALALFQWRSLPWHALRLGVDWMWIRQSVGRSGLIWVSTIALTGGTLVDRFVVASYLSLDLVGVVTFYGLFASALYSLIESSVFYAYPKLVSLHHRGDRMGFAREVKRLAVTAAALGALIALSLAVAVPILGAMTERAPLAEHALTLWLLLIGTWIRIIAQALYLALFASHQDRAIWLGDLLYIVPALGGNLVLVPIFGFVGIGYSSILSGLFILLWRSWQVRADWHGKQLHRQASVL